MKVMQKQGDKMAYFHMFFTYFSQAFHMHINFHIDVKFCIVK